MINGRWASHCGVSRLGAVQAAGTKATTRLTMKRRAAANDGMIYPASTFDDFVSMAERIQMDSWIIDALYEIDAETTGTAPPDPHDIERRLAELKKRHRGA